MGVPSSLSILGPKAAARYPCPNLAPRSINSRKDYPTTGQLHHFPITSKLPIYKVRVGSQSLRVFIKAISAMEGWGLPCPMVIPYRFLNLSVFLHICLANEYWSNHQTSMATRHSSLYSQQGRPSESIGSSLRYRSRYSFRIHTQASPVIRPHSSHR